METVIIQRREAINMTMNKKVGIRIKKSCIPETLLLALLGFYVCLTHWLWFGRGIQETVMILLSVVVLMRSGNRLTISAKQLADFLLWAMLIVICLIGITRANSHKYLVSDLKAMVGTVLVATAALASVRRLMTYGIDFLDFLFSFLNQYVLLNDIIIVIQYFVPYFLMNRAAIQSVNNRNYFDQLTGFFGINGTTRWDVWTVVLIILNFHIAYKRNDKKIIRYNLVLFLVSLLICILNSARTFLIIAPMTIAIYLFLIKKVNLTGRMKQILLIFSVMLAAFGIYLVNPYVNSSINHLLADKGAIYFSGPWVRNIPWRRK